MGLEEALPSCPLTDGDRLVALVEVMATPPDPRMPAVLAWDPAAAPLAVDPGARWADVAPILAAHPASGLVLR